MYLDTVIRTDSAHCLSCTKPTTANNRSLGVWNSKEGQFNTLPQESLQSWHQHQIQWHRRHPAYALCVRTSHRNLGCFPVDMIFAPTACNSTIQRRPLLAANSSVHHVTLTVSYPKEGWRSCRRPSHPWTMVKVKQQLAR